jgi:hypothetical protein
MHDVLLAGCEFLAGWLALLIVMYVFVCLCMFYWLIRTNFMFVSCLDYSAVCGGAHHVS